MYEAYLRRKAIVKRRTLFSEIGFCMASCSYIYIYIIIYVCIFIYVKMAAPWGSLTLLSYYSLCPHLRSH